MISSYLEKNLTFDDIKTLAEGTGIDLILCGWGGINYQNFNDKSVELEKNIRSQGITPQNIVRIVGLCPDFHSCDPDFYDPADNIYSVLGGDYEHPYKVLGETNPENVLIIAKEGFRYGTSFLDTLILLEQVKGHDFSRFKPPYKFVFSKKVTYPKTNEISENQIRVITPDNPIFGAISLNSFRKKVFSTAATSFCL